jgi:hypothetical protein
MKSRGTLALLAVAVALGLYVWLVEIRGAEKKLEAESAARTIVAIAPAGVTGLTLPTSDAAPAVLTRAADATWQLEAPVVYPADPDAVERALRALEKIESTSEIAPIPSDREPFGLGADRKIVEIRAGEAAPQTLYLGANTPVGGGRYLELANDPNRIFTVSSTALPDLEPTLVGLREKRVLRLPSSEITELSVRSGGVLIAKAAKTETGWSLVEPEAAPADVEKITSLLEDLALARASAFEDAPKPRAAYGFAGPSLEVEVRAGERVERLAIATADGRTWLERAGDPVILEVNEIVRTGVPTAFFDYRAKRVLTFDVESAKAVELVFPRTNESQRVTRDGEGWKSAKTDVTLKPIEVEDLLDALAALDATSVIEASPDRAALGLEPALATIRVYGDGDALLGEVSFGDPHPDDGLPALSSQSPLVWRVSNDVGRAVPLSPEAYTNLLVQSAPSPAPATEATPEEPVTP